MKENTTRKKAFRNRFNKLGSKEWLPFQKSWFRFDDQAGLYESNLRFFILPQPGIEMPVYFYGSDSARNIMQEVASRNSCRLTENPGQPAHFAVIDLLDSVHAEISLAEYLKLKDEILSLSGQLLEQLDERRFLVIFIRNIQQQTTFYPFAWDLAKSIAEIFSLKDEKIAGLETDNSEREKDGSSVFKTDGSCFYCLYFRKDENSPGRLTTETDFGFFRNTQQQAGVLSQPEPLPAWHILKPPPRKKNEILHPAKYPENLVDLFVNTFTRPGEFVFDPMSGTGSTQVGALRNGRNGIGAELSEFFCNIAVSRCQAFLAENDGRTEETSTDRSFRILNRDAREITATDFPEIDYVLTSPPYWDMLNMRGAEYQARRKEKGLQLSYSDDLNDLGNIADYEAFVNQLCEIYFNIAELLKPGRYITIVVKNIKKKGRNYPLAWDLAARLQQKLILLPEVFWCQDDISIAPYGYGYTWVSNTFHQYCLTFQKPLEKK